LEWQREKRASLDADAALLALHQQLGRTPRPFEIRLAKIKGGCSCTGCIMSYLAFVLGAFLLNGGIALLSGLSSMMGVDGGNLNPDAETSGFAIGVILFPFLLSSGAIVVGLGFIRGKVLALAELQGKFVASPPSHEGGPSTCRCCGAPLEIKPGEMCSPCYYCGSQNLVTLEPQWCDELRKHASQTLESVQEALAVYTKELSTAKWRLVRNIIVFVLFTFLITSSENESLSTRWPPTGFESFVEHRSVLLLNPNEELKLNAPIQFKYKTSNSYFPGEFQYFSSVYFFVPLKKGEELSIDFLKETAPARVQIVAENDSKAITDRSRRSPHWLSLSGRPATYKAEKTSWHCVSIRADEDKKEALYEIEFSVAGREISWSVPDLSEARIDEIPLNLLPTSAPTSMPDSSWSKLDGVEVQLDQKGLVKRVRGQSLDSPVPLASGDSQGTEDWLKAYGPGRVRQMERESNREHLYWERLYDTPNGALRIRQVGTAFAEFELFRGENYSVPKGGIVAKKKAPKPVSSPKESATPADGKELGPNLNSKDFVLDQKTPITIRGLRPGSTREQVEKILGAPKLEWGRYAYYGEETLCYWNGKVRWIHGPKIMQGEKEFSLTGEARDFDAKAGPPLFTVAVYGGPRGTADAYNFKTTFHRVGDDILLVDRGRLKDKIVSGALLSGSLFPKGKPVKVIPVRQGGTYAKVDKLELKAGPADLDPLWSYFGQVQLSYLFSHSDSESLLPAKLAKDSGNEQFYYRLFLESRYPEFCLELWKNAFSFL